jgi:hypothetical protein
MTPFQLIRLAPLMERTSGRPEIVIGLIDGPVVIHHPELESELRQRSGVLAGYSWDKSPEQRILA